MKALSQLTDEELIARIKSTGDTSGFSVLYSRYAHILLGWCLRYLKEANSSEDAVMDIMQQLLENIQRYDIKNFKNWLFLVTRNHCYLKLKQKTEVLVDDISKIDSPEFMENDSINHLKTERTEDALHEAIEALKGEQKECIVLFYFKKKSYKEIEEITGYDIKKVKSYIQNGKRNLRLSLQGIMDED